MIVDEGLDTGAEINDVVTTEYWLQSTNVYIFILHIITITFRSCLQILLSEILKVIKFWIIIIYMFRYIFSLYFN